MEDKRSSNDPFADFTHEELEEVEIAVEEMEAETYDSDEIFYDDNDEPVEEIITTIEKINPEENDSYEIVYDDNDEESCDLLASLSPEPHEETNNIVDSVEWLVLDDGEYEDQQPSSSTITAKRNRNPEIWKQNVRIALCQRGLPYVDRNGFARPGKSVGPACGDSCRHKCTKNITPKKRQEIHDYFWSLDKEERNTFYANFVKKVSIKRRRVLINNENNPTKKFSFQYFLKPDDRTVQVCQKYFLNTLSITISVISYFFSKHVEEDGIESGVKPLNCGRNGRTKRQEKIKKIEKVLETKEAIEETEVGETASFEIVYDDSDAKVSDLFANLSPEPLEEQTTIVQEIDEEQNDLYKILHDDDDEGSCDLSSHLSPELLEETNTNNLVDSVTPDGGEYHNQHPNISKTSTITRKRKRNPELSKKNIERPGRTVGPACGNSCRHMCKKKITPEKRQEIHDYFWSLDKEERNVFYANFVKRVPIKRRRVRIINNNPARKASFEYYLKLDDRTIQVCQKYFLNTLSISAMTILYFFSKHFKEDKIESNIKLLKCERKDHSEEQFKKVEDICETSTFHGEMKHTFEEIDVGKTDSDECVYEENDEGSCDQFAHSRPESDEEINNFVNGVEWLVPDDGDYQDRNHETPKPSTITRKRKRNPELWKKNIRSALCQRGLPYIDKNGIARPGKTVGPACGNSCRHMCKKKITPEKRQEIHDYFWSLDKEERNVFYANFVKRVPIKRRRARSNKKNPLKKCSFQYFLKRDDLTIQVCQKYFLNTLSISTMAISYFFSKHCGKDNIESVSKAKSLNCRKKSLVEDKIKDGVKTDSDERFSGDNDEESCHSFAHSRSTLNEETNYAEIDGGKTDSDERISDDNGEDSCDSFAHSIPQPIEEPKNTVNAIEGLGSDDGEYQDQHLSAPKTSTITKPRKRNPELWKQNVRKSLCQRGLPYVDRNGITRPGKTVGPVCGDSCYHNCTKKITPEQRQEIHDYFWSLDRSERYEFYANFVKRGPIKRRRVRVYANNILKKNTFHYFLKPDDRTIQVCLKYFLNTLSISTMAISYFFSKHYEKDTIESVFMPSSFGRIRMTKKEQLEEVVNHIKIFPVLDSLYSSNSTNRQYLDSCLNINKMYSLYQQKAQYPVSLRTYRNIFNTKFNYSFNIPNKDLCDKCTVHKTQKSAGEAIVFEKHLAEIELTKSELNADLKNINLNNAVLLYDMQNVYSLPKIWASNYFYKRKLCVYNLTGTLVLPGLKVTYCAIWNESNSGRSENDIASALTRILDEVVKDFPKIIGLTLWSDLCVPQNKNQMTASAMLQFLYDNPSIQYINQKFSEPGHNSVQEVDSVQSAIEKYLKEMEIPSQATLVRYLRNAKLTKVYLRVLELGSDDFKSFDCKSEKLNFSSIPFAECKSLIFKQNDLFKIGRKLSFQDNSYVFYSLKKKTTRFYKANKLWDEPIQLSGKKQICHQKIADLKSMLPIITDKADKNFYHNILNE